MDDFGPILYFVALAIFYIYRTIRKNKKKNQGKQPPKAKPRSRQPQQKKTQQQPGKSLEEILAELYPETQQSKPKPPPPPPVSQSRPMVSEHESRTDMSSNYREAEALLNDPNRHRLKFKQDDDMKHYNEVQEKKKIKFNLRQGIISQMILERPYR